MAVFFMAANSAAKRISGGKVYVMPENARVSAAAEAEGNSQGENGGPRLSLDGVESGFQYRLTYCRSRKPVLETINEEPISSR